MKKLSIVLLFFIFFILLLPQKILALKSLDVIINEIAWMGTDGSANDEWIELYNNTDQDINLEGWGLYEAGGETLIEPLTGTIQAKSFYLVERTDDATLPNIPASQEPSGWGGYGLKNSGEYLQLLDNNSNIIDEINCSSGWFKGDNSTKQTMERINSLSFGNNPLNWQTSNNPGGTPKFQNSSGYKAPAPTPSSSPLSSPLPSVSPSPSPSSSPSILTLPEFEFEPKPTPSPKSKDQSAKEPIPVVYSSGILINEILASPQETDSENEFIELKNTKNNEADISGWKIKDTVGSVKTYTFAKGTKIAGLGFLVLYRPETKITLNNNQDSIKLIRPDDKIEDSVSYSNAPQGLSYNRTEFNNWKWSKKITPGKENMIVKNEKKSKKENLAEKTAPRKNLAAKTFFSNTSVNPKKLAGQAFRNQNFLTSFIAAFIFAVFSGVAVLFLK